MSRAISRKSKNSQRRRTSSFVDGEATAPLLPSKALPRNGKSRNPPTMRDIFTYPTTIALISYSFFAFHSVAYDQNITVFMNTPTIPRTPDNYQLPFYFNGGFGLNSGEIGTIFTVYGVTSALIQFILYPALVARFGVVNCYRLCCKCLPLSCPPTVLTRRCSRCSAIHLFRHTLCFAI